MGSCTGAALDKVSNQYLTATVTGLVIAILFSLTAIIVRSIAAPEMDGKISADAAHFKTLP
jgi:hypothetical protein